LEIDCNLWRVAATTRCSTLLDLITATAMGSRLLSRWLNRPLARCSGAAVAPGTHPSTLLDQHYHEALQPAAQSFGDIDRILAR